MRLILLSVCLATQIFTSYSHNATEIIKYPAGHIKKDTPEKYMVNKHLNCKEMKCPAVSQPICVKIGYTSEEKKHQTKYVIMLNRCEKDYLSCYDDLITLELPMKYCVPYNKKYQKRRPGGIDVRARKKLEVHKMRAKRSPREHFLDAKKNTQMRYETKSRHEKKNHRSKKKHSKDRYKTKPKQHKHSTNSLLDKSKPKQDKELFSEKTELNQNPLSEIYEPKPARELTEEGDFVISFNFSSGLPNSMNIQREIKRDNVLELLRDENDKEQKMNKLHDDLKKQLMSGSGNPFEPFISVGLEHVPPKKGVHHQLSGGGKDDFGKAHNDAWKIASQAAIHYQKHKESSDRNKPKEQGWGEAVQGLIDLLYKEETTTARNNFVPYLSVDMKKHAAKARSHGKSLSFGKVNTEKPNMLSISVGLDPGVGARVVKDWQSTSSETDELGERARFRAVPEPLSTSSEGDTSADYSENDNEKSNVDFFRRVNRRKRNAGETIESTTPEVKSKDGQSDTKLQLKQLFPKVFQNNKPKSQTTENNQKVNKEPGGKGLRIGAIFKKPMFAEVPKVIKDKSQLKERNINNSEKFKKKGGGTGSIFKKPMFAKVIKYNKGNNKLKERNLKGSKESEETGVDTEALFKKPIITDLSSNNKEKSKLTDNNPKDSGESEREAEVTTFSDDKPMFAELTRHHKGKGKFKEHQPNDSKESEGESVGTGSIFKKPMFAKVSSDNKGKIKLKERDQNDSEESGGEGEGTGSIFKKPMFAEVSSNNKGETKFKESNSKDSGEYENEDEITKSLDEKPMFAELTRHHKGKGKFKEHNLNHSKEFKGESVGTESILKKPMFAELTRVHKENSKLKKHKPKDRTDSEGESVETGSIFRKPMFAILSNDNEKKSKLKERNEKVGEKSGGESIDTGSIFKKPMFAEVTKNRHNPSHGEDTGGKAIDSSSLFKKPMFAKVTKDNNRKNKLKEHNPNGSEENKGKSNKESQEKNTGSLFKKPMFAEEAKYNKENNKLKENSPADTDEIRNKDEESLFKKPMFMEHNAENKNYRSKDKKYEAKNIHKSQDENTKLANKNKKYKVKQKKAKEPPPTLVLSAENAEEGTRSKTALADDEESSEEFVGTRTTLQDGSVDMKQYRARCPETCPARDVMVCAVCKDGIYRTFMSTCHLKKYNCYHTAEQMTLVSRRPCVMSAPYHSDLRQLTGKLTEPNDDDPVLRYKWCLRKQRGNAPYPDERCVLNNRLKIKQHVKDGFDDDFKEQFFGTDEDETTEQ